MNAKKAKQRIDRHNDWSKPSVEAAADMIMAALKMTETIRGRRNEDAVKQNMAAESTDKPWRSSADDNTTLRISNKCAHLDPPLQNERKKRQPTQESRHDSKPKRREDEAFRIRERSACE